MQLIFSGCQISWPSADASTDDITKNLAVILLEGQCSVECAIISRHILTSFTCEWPNILLNSGRTRAYKYMYIAVHIHVHCCTYLNSVCDCAGPKNIFCGLLMYSNVWNSRQKLFRCTYMLMYASVLFLTYKSQGSYILLDTQDLKKRL